MNNSKTNKILQRYIGIIKCLNRGEKSAEGPAPHKPVLLLSVIYLFTKGIIKVNRISITPELEETFKNYWKLTKRTLDITMPFYHLTGDEFWHLHPFIEKEEKFRRFGKIRKLCDLRELVEFASLDRELFDLLIVPKYREVIRQALIDTYFSNSKQEIENLEAEVEQI